MNKVKVEQLGANAEVYNGMTVKAGKKYYIISSSPFENSVMVFACNSKGHCKNTTDLWSGYTFAKAIEFLETNQP
jgi:hypothetical protein